jgi:hypothetical protein
MPVSDSLFGIGALVEMVLDSMPAAFQKAEIAVVADQVPVVQLLAETALAVGPDRAADLAAARLSGAEMAAMVPLLQPVALRRTSRMRLRDHRDLLPGLRKRLLGTAPEGDSPPVQLERIRLRTLITLVAGVVAAYVLIGQLSKASLGTIFQQADWRWGILVVLLSMVTYVGATFELTGFVLERLNLVRALLAQIAGSFVTLVTPAAVGGVALNIRFLRKANVSPSDAGSSVGVSQVIAFSLHILLLVIFAAFTRTASRSSLRPPGWVWIALATLAAVVLIALAIPAGRRLLRSRLAPALSQLIPRLLNIAQHPAKLAAGIGGALLLTAAADGGLHLLPRLAPTSSSAPSPTGSAPDSDARQPTERASAAPGGSLRQRG